MEKSKFKSVKFLPFDLELEYSQRPEGEIYWTNNVAFGNSALNDVYFTDSCIEQYPELFEVEKAEREFQEDTWYKAQYWYSEPWEAVKFVDGKFRRNGFEKEYPAHFFDEIGEKIEL